jgi:branched-subunit amino acid aminotransferase/4-amino-4-deoxychorismate lyase
MNGEFLPSGGTGLPLHDAGFVFGATVTDLVRTFGRRLFRFDAHLRRFRDNCAACHIDLLRDDAGITAAAEELVARNARALPPGGDLGLILFATPGPIGFYVGEPDRVTGSDPTFGMSTFALPFSRYRPLHSRGARLVIPEQRHAFGIPPTIKQRSRMGWWLAQQQARVIDPLADPLLLDAHGFVTETPSANLIAVIDGVACTPPAGTVLPGVTLSIVREMIPDLCERPITPDDCSAADELVLTCTTWCAAGVSRLNGRAVPWPGPLYERVIDELSKLAGIDIRGQIAG